MTRHIVALDLGTTSCRALAFTLAGRVAGQASRTYPLYTPQSGFVEQDPAELLAAADAVVPEALRRAGARPEEVLGIALSTYMHALVVQDAAGRCLTPAITWADGRSALQADAARARPDWRELYRRTGCPPHTMYPLYKLMWLQAHRPDLMARATRCGGVKSLLLEHWTGEYAVDYSIASATGLFHLKALDWDAGALALAGIDHGRLPRPVPTRTQFGLTAAAAGRLGLRPGTPVVAGASDGVLSNLGSGGVDPGVLVAMVGTSGALRARVHHPEADPHARLWCYYLDQDAWILGGSLNNGGIVLRWVRDLLYTPETPYAAMIAEAETAPAGSDGLVFLPFLAGERAPGFNARARGVWFGLGLEHRRAHLVRSALEAVAFRLYSVLGPLEEHTGPAREIRSSGGFAHSPFWLQICADVFGRQVAVPGQTEGSALGAFILGAVALGQVADLDEVHRHVAVHRRLQPNPAHRAVYDGLWDVYRQVYAGARDAWAALARVRAAAGPP